MKEFLEKTLRQNVTIHKTNKFYNQLPLAFKSKYIIYHVETNGQIWLAIEPKTDLGLVQLRRDRLMIEKITQLNCVIFFRNTTFYIKEKLLQEGIPFVINHKQVYLPFIGYLLINEKERNLVPVHLISYLTQKLILTAIYEKWNHVTVTQAAGMLNVSKMSISRCFDEIEYLNIDILDLQGKSRIINIPEDIRQLWEDLQTVLRSPVIKRFEFPEDLYLKHKGGLSALSEYTLISDNVYPTYIITKKDLSEIKHIKQIYSSEEIGCVVLELGYYIDFNHQGIEDPLSIVLTIADQDKEDERVTKSIHDMLEKYVW